MLLLRVRSAHTHTHTASTVCVCVCNEMHADLFVMPCTVQNTAHITRAGSL